MMTYLALTRTDRVRGTRAAVGHGAGSRARGAFRRAVAAPAAKPLAGEWSMLEIFEHLVLAEREVSAVLSAKRTYFICTGVKLFAPGFFR